MNDDNIQELVDLSRFYYAENITQCHLIDEFEREYTSSKSIYWYTREGFLYKMVNKSLRTEDFDVPYAMRTFIRHLHVKIAHCHRNKHFNQQQWILYREQSMLNEELEKLKTISVDSYRFRVFYQQR